MVRRRLMLTMLALAAAALAGCAEKPTLRLHHAQLHSATIQGVGMDIFVQVHNPNSYDIQIRRVRAQVVIGGRYPLPPFSFNPNQWLPSDERTLVRVPMLIPYPLVPRILAETVTSPVVFYTVQGSADVTAIRLLGVERDNVPINEVGSVPRRDLAAAAARSLPF